MEPVKMDEPKASEIPSIPEPAEPERGGKSDLFARKKPRTRWVRLSDGKRYLVRALRPKEISEINKLCLNEVPDPEKPDIVKPDGTVIKGEKKYEWDIMRPYYLIAKSLCEPDGKPMYRNAMMGPDDAWIAGGIEISEKMEYGDTNTLLEEVQDISGLSMKARAALGKGSGEIQTGGS
jgi:hypothetical protein